MNSLEIIFAIILALGNVFFIITTVVAVVFMIKFAKIIMSVEDQIDESLDILDASYATISKVLQIPLASDDQYARSVVKSMKDSKRAVLLVANKLTSFASKPHQISDDSENQ